MYWVKTFIYTYMYSAFVFGFAPRFSFWWPQNWQFVGLHFTNLTSRMQGFKRSHLFIYNVNAMMDRFTPWTLGFGVLFLLPIYSSVDLQLEWAVHQPPFHCGSAVFVPFSHGELAEIRLVSLSCPAGSWRTSARPCKCGKLESCCSPFAFIGYAESYGPERHRTNKMITCIHIGQTFPKSGKNRYWVKS